MTTIDYMITLSFTVILCLFSADMANCGVQGEIELIRMVETGRAANREKLRTWKGKARISGRSSGQDGKMSAGNMVTDVSFAYDAARNWWRWNVEQYEARDGSEDVLPGDEPKSRWSGLVKDSVYYRVPSVDLPEDGEPGHMTINHWRKGRSFAADMGIDFMEMSGGKSAAGLPSFATLEIWRDDARVDVTITREGSLVVLETRAVGFNNINRYTFDLSKGCNLVGFFAEGDTYGPNSRTYSYEKTDGLWVPTRVEARSQDKGTGRVTESTILLMDHSENEPLSAEEFTLASIGMLPGDEVQDLRTGTFYIYKSKEKPLQPAFVGGILEDLEELPSDEPPVAAVAEAPTPEPPTAAGAPQVEAPEGRSFPGPLALVGAAILLAVALLAWRTTKK